MKEKTKSGGYGTLLSAVSEKKEIIVKSVVFAFAACLFGRAELLFETSPLGLAFVCAVHEGIPFASLGLALGTLFADPLKTASTLSGLAVSLSFRYALSYVLRRSKGSLLSLNDGLAARIASAAAGGFTVSAIRVIYNGFRYYDLLAAAFYMLCVCGGVFAYSAFLDAGSRGTERYGAGVAALIYSAVISLSGISMFGIRASALAAFTLTLIAGRRCGALFGVAAGFLCGAATELSLCPVYGSVGFLCGLLSHFSAYIGILFSLVSGLFIGLQTGGFSTLVSLLPEASVAACLVLPAEYFGKLKGGRTVRLLKSGEKARSSAAPAAKDAALRERQSVIRMAEAYGSLASVMRGISEDERRPDKRRLARVFSDTAASFCGGCPKKAVCFPDAVSFPAAVDAAAAGKPVTADLLPAAVAANCRHKDALTAKLGIRTGDYLRRLTESDRAGAASESCAFTSGLLRASADASSRSFETDRESTALLADQPLFREAFHGDVTVTGSRKKYITACCDIGGPRLNAAELRRAAEKALGISLTEPELSPWEDRIVFRTEQSPVIDADHASSGAAKEDRLINGDTSFSVRCGDMLYFAVCDGMGSGRDAAVSSRLAGVTLGRLFYADADGSDALDTLNRLMRLRRTECFSTVDVLALDTLDGSAVFYKCGACPSFIIRDGKVYGITSHTPPVGIMEKLSAEKIALKLKPDDTVVMVSDGVTGQTEDTESIVATLRSAAGASPETVCDAVLENAKTAHGLRDDMTVMAVRIKRIKN